MNSRYKGMKEKRNVAQDKVLNNVKSVCSVLLEISPKKFKSKKEVVEFVAKNASFAIIDSLGENPSRLQQKDLNVLTKVFYSMRVGNKKVASTFSEDDLKHGYLIFKNSQKIKKVAFILPDQDFVDELARKAYKAICASKPSNISKFLAGIIHSSFFDYAMDKNLLLTSSFFITLKEKFGKKLEEKFGTSELNFYATNVVDKKAADVLKESGFANIKEAHKISDETLEDVFNSLQDVYKGFSASKVGERIMVLSDLMSVDDLVMERMSRFLTDKTGCEYELSFA